MARMRKLSRREDISQAVDRAMRTTRAGKAKEQAKGNKSKDNKPKNKNKSGNKGAVDGIGAKRNKNAMKRESELSKSVDEKTQQSIENLKPGEVDLTGAPALKTTNTNVDPNAAPAMPTVDNSTFDRAKYENMAYSSLTRNFDRDQAREMELQKQELAERGLPYSPGDTTSAYGQALQGINERWDQKRDAAAQQAYTMADSSMATGASVGNIKYEQGLGLRKQGITEQQTQVQNEQANVAGQNAARNQFVNEAMGVHNVPLQDATALQGLSKDSDLIAAYMNKYGIDKDAATKMAVADKAAGATITSASIGAEAAKYAADKRGSSESGAVYH